MTTYLRSLVVGLPLSLLAITACTGDANAPNNVPTGGGAEDAPFKASARTTQEIGVDTWAVKRGTNAVEIRGAKGSELRATFNFERTVDVEGRQILRATSDFQGSGAIAVRELPNGDGEVIENSLSDASAALAALKRASADVETRSTGGGGLTSQSLHPNDMNLTCPSGWNTAQNCLLSSVWALAAVGTSELCVTVVGCAVPGFFLVDSGAYGAVCGAGLGCNVMED